MDFEFITSLGLVALLSILLVVTSVKKVPGIGVGISLLIIGIILWQRGSVIGFLGLQQPDNWKLVIVISIVAGTIIALFSTLILEPFIDRITGKSHDHSMFDGLRGNVKNLLLMLLVVWIVVAFAEEIIFRGYLMKELLLILGSNRFALILNILLSSALFGVAHWYQGRSGVITTGLIGIIFSSLFIWNNYNLWLLILTHGIIDTIGLTLICFRGDIFLKKVVGRLWSTNP